MEARLCPNCGAYWQCDCRIEAPPPPPADAARPEDPAPRMRYEDACQHDWAETVGVDIDIDLTDRRVLVCRLCGLYAVQDRV